MASLLVLTSSCFVVSKERTRENKSWHTLVATYERRQLFVTKIHMSQDKNRCLYLIHDASYARWLVKIIKTCVSCKLRLMQIASYLPRIHKCPNYLLRQGFHSGFGGGRWHHEPRTSLCIHRRNGKKITALASLYQTLSDIQGDKRGAIQHNVHDSLPRVGRKPFRWRYKISRRVVDDYVGKAELFDANVDGVFYGFGIPDIHLYWENL